MIAAAVGVCVACDAGGPSLEPMEGPTVLWTDPAGGAEGVPRLGPFLVGMDARLLPGSVSRATVRLHSGALQAFLSVRFDPVDRVIVAVPFFDQPLAPEVTWRLVVEGVRDLDGQPMAASHVSVFRTGEPVGDVAEAPQASWSTVEPLFQRSCLGAGCHGPDDGALGLDLSSPQAVRATAIGVPSRQLPGGTATAEGARGAISLAALPLVDVVAGAGRPAGSYLLYKVLGDPHVFGDAMPPPGASQPPLTLDEQRTIAAWILAGAPTDAD